MLNAAGLKRFGVGMVLIAGLTSLSAKAHDCDSLLVPSRPLGVIRVSPEFYSRSMTLEVLSAEHFFKPVRPVSQTVQQLIIEPYSPQVALERLQLALVAEGNGATVLWIHERLNLSSDHQKVYRLKISPQDLDLFYGSESHRWVHEILIKLEIIDPMTPQFQIKRGARLGRAIGGSSQHDID